MKLVHIADTHLGLAQFNRIDPDNGMNLREELIYGNFLHSVDRILALRPDVLVHAGDLFDQVRPKTMAYTTALEALDRFADAGIPVVLVAGNHSMPKTRYTPSPFRVLEFHRSELHAAYRYRYERVEIGDAVFHLIPNMLRPGDYRTAYDEVVCDPGRLNVLVTHGLASSLRDRRLNTVAEHEIDATILSGGFDYIALGHYHGQVQAGSRAWYSGSAEYLSYGEIKDTKGGLLVDPGRGSVDHLSLVNTPMIDLGTIDCQEEPSRAIPGMIKAAIEKGRPDLVSLAQVTVVCQSREQAKAIDHQALARERERLLDLKIKTVIREEDCPVPDEQDLRAIDYLAEFDIFLKKKNLAPREAGFVRDEGRAALLAAIRGDEDAP
jgi:DNA repair exonuclease SbcCD nuclease subunit